VHLVLKVDVLYHEMKFALALKRTDGAVNGVEELYLPLYSEMLDMLQKEVGHADVYRPMAKTSRCWKADVG